MAVRSYTLQRVQLGVETIPGTLVSTSLRFADVWAMPTPNIPVNMIDGPGFKIPVSTTVGREFTSWDLSGAADYNAIKYLLDMHAETCTGGGGTWAAAVDPDDPDTISTYSLGWGNSVRCEEAAYGICPDLQLSFTETECSISGRLVSRTLTEGSTYDAGTLIPAAPIGPKHWKLQEGATVGGLADLTDVLEVRLVSNARWFTQNFAVPSQSSFGDIGEGAMDLSCEVVVEHGSNAATWMSRLRNSTPRTWRIQADDAVPTPDYQFRATFVGMIEAAPNSRQGELYGTTFTIRPVFDSTFADAIQFSLINGVS